MPEYITYTRGEQEKKRQKKANKHTIKAATQIFQSAKTSLLLFNMRNSEINQKSCKFPLSVVVVRGAVLAVPLRILPAGHQTDGRLQGVVAAV